MNLKTGALDGIRVIDLSRVLSGPFCTQILADHGADVIKVEPPSGDETRTWGPPFIGDTAAYFHGVNRNKRGVSLDLSSDEGRARLLDLLGSADVLVENFKTGTMDRWGLGYDVLSERFPELIVCCISGFGPDGPLGGYPGYDAAVQAMSGLMSINGDAGGDPTRIGVPIVDMVTGLNASIGVLLALQERGQSGRGQLVNLSLYDCALSLLHPHATNFFASGALPQRTGNAHPNIAPYDIFPTSNVPLFLAVGNNKQFSVLCEVLGAGDVVSDPRFNSNQARSVNRIELRSRLVGLMKELDGEALAARLMDAGVPCSTVNTVEQSLGHRHTDHTNMVVEIDDYVGVASPIKLARTPPTYRRRPPHQNEHQELVG